MGSCCSADPKSAQIERLFKEYEKEQNNKIRVLLLGAGGSGKSTLFKQIQRIGKDEYSFKEVDRSEACQIIRVNLVRAMLVLLCESQKFGLQKSQDFIDCFLDVDHPRNIELPNEWKDLNPSQSSQNSMYNNNQIGGSGTDSGTDSNKIYVESLDHFCELVQTSVNIIIDAHSTCQAALSDPGVDSHSGYITNTYNINIYHLNTKNNNNNSNNSNNNSNGNYEMKQHNDLQVQWSEDSYEWQPQIGDAIAFLWKLPAVQRTFDSRHGRFSFPDNLDYFFNKGE